MKNHPDVGKLPLPEVMDTLPGFGDSRINSRSLGATDQTVSLSVPENGEMKTENHVESTGESQRDAQLVTRSHEKSAWPGGGIRTPGFTG
jgi:hypothetical protein